MNKTTKIILIGGSIVGVSIALIFVAKKIAKTITERKQKQIEQDIKDDTTGGGSSTQENVESQSTYNPTNDMKLLAGYILGVNFMVYPDEVNGIIMKLNNADLKKLAGWWKAKYNRTLYYDLDDELDQCGWAWSNCYEDSMKRLSSLGLR